MICCQGCKGAPPWFICRNPLALSWLNTSIGCPCHIAAESIAAKQPNKLGHRDPTANTAIGNLEKRKR